jgi:uncharacterized protein YbjT (DUF2867 family)
LDGVRKVFLYAQPAGIAEFAAAAKAAGVEHVVLLSSLFVVFADVETHPIAKQHADVARVLVESGLDWTFVRPGGFATNSIGWWGASVRAERVARTAFPEAHSALIHESDIAAVSVQALLDDAHRGKAYSLSGPESLTQRQQVETIADALGEPVRVEEIDEQVYRTELGKSLPAGLVDTLASGFAATVGRPAQIYSGVQDVLGRPALSFTQWAKDHVADFR